MFLLLLLLPLPLFFVLVFLFFVALLIVKSLDRRCYFDCLYIPASFRGLVLAIGLFLGLFHWITEEVVAGAFQDLGLLFLLLLLIKPFIRVIVTFHVQFVVLMLKLFALVVRLRFIVFLFYFLLLKELFSVLSQLLNLFSLLFVVNVFILFILQSIVLLLSLSLLLVDWILCFTCLIPFLWLSCLF
jgi:hypothetical protein